jgi:MerR family mercuric resistance operon transcriptional regulator
MLQRLRFIRGAQGAGFTLAEIKELLKLDRTQDRRRIQILARSRLLDLEAQVRKLRPIIGALKGLIHHCETMPADQACPIVDAFDR